LQATFADPGGRLQHLLQEASVEGAGPELVSQRAFHTLAERGIRRFGAMGSWIAEIT
jgi:hypothetical protein